jgi:putative methyltransferase (TIGR04325 family)
MNAPIALFVYSRPDHTYQIIEALKRNSEAAHTDLIIFSDAAKMQKHNTAVKQVRNYITKINGFRSLKIHHRPYNVGLAKSIIEGVTEVLKHHDRVIVMEDDLVTSPYFLKYMNEGLDLFADNDRVISIHGYVYPVEESLPEAFFLRGADCWGWATWRRGWVQFNPDGRLLLDDLKRQKLLKAFDFNGTYSYSEMLRGQIEGSNDSWAVRWHASAFLANKLTLYPGRSLVHNIGNDGTGIHCGTSVALDAELSTSPIHFDDVVVEESVVAKKVFGDFFRTKHPPLQRMLAHILPVNVRQQLTAFAKNWLPPTIARQLRRLPRLGSDITFEGPFSNWEEAAECSSGYDCEQILEKVLAATLKVKRSEAIFERDSVLFKKIQYAWPVTTGLMWAAARDGGRLSVLDFGGSLGSIYFQNHKFLEGLKAVRWSVVEQAHFVKAGREHIQDGRLVFYPTIAECVEEETPNVVLLSSVLQYLEKPYAILDELVQSGVDIILIDRTSFYNGEEDLIALQKVAEAIYPASYPLWVFSKKKFINRLSETFRLVTETLSPEGFVTLASESFSFNGLVMQRKYNES